MTEKGKRVLVIGEVCREISPAALTRLGPGRLVSCGTPDDGPGGDGVNAAVALACFGEEALLCSSIGTDPDGRLTARQLSDITVPGRGKFDSRFVRQDAACGTPLKISLPQTDGHAPESVMLRREDYEISPETIDDAFMCYPDVTLLMGSASRAGCAKIAGKARPRDSSLIIADCGDALSLKTLGECDVLSLTESRVTGITGIRLGDQDSCLRAVSKLGELVKADYYLLRLPERGYFISDSSFYTFIPAYDIPPSDARECDAIFCAMFVHAFIESGGDLRGSCEYGAAGVAAYVTSGRQMLPTDGEIRSFAGQNGIKL